MNAPSAADLAERHIALERKFATVQRVVTWVAAVWIVMLSFLGVFFFPYVLIRWGFVK